MPKTNAYVGKPIGLSNLTTWPVTADTPEAYTAGEPAKLARAIEVQMSPQFAEGMLESDDGIEDEISTMTAIEVTIGSSQLTEDIRGQLLGHTVDASGGMSENQTDAPQKVALAFRSLLSKEDGEDKYVYFVLYSGRFQEFEERFQTQQRGQITYQTHTGLKGTFYGRQMDGEIRYRLREGATDDPSNKVKITAWFTEPQESTPGA